MFIDCTYISGRGFKNQSGKDHNDGLKRQLSVATISWVISLPGAGKWGSRML